MEFSRTVLKPTVERSKKLKDVRTGRAAKQTMVDATTGKGGRSDCRDFGSRETLRGADTPDAFG